MTEDSPEGLFPEQRIKVKPSSTSGTRSGFSELLSRFWGFEQLVGSALIKIVYYVGVVSIGVFALLAILAMLGLVDGASRGGLFSPVGFGGALGGSLSIVFLAVVYAVIWRFVCEMSLLAYLTYQRLGEIRDRLPVK